MNIEERITAFLNLDHKIQLDSWEELLSIGNDFLKFDNKNSLLAKKIAESILYHRSLTGSSKAYESAFEIDTDLLFVSIPIARIAYNKSKSLKEFIMAGIYYSDVLPNRFDRDELEKEINQLNETT